jgi:hypothetical protein
MEKPATDFSRFFHDYIKHTHRFDWLQQVFLWLYLTHPSPRLTSEGFSMTISNTPIAWHSHGKICWSQLKRCVLDIVMENPAEVSRGDRYVTDFSRFFHDYIKHTHLFDWLQQVFPWLYQTHPSLRLTSPGFSMTMSSTHLFNWLHQVFPWLSSTHLCNCLQQVFHDYMGVFEIVIEKPAEVSRSGECVWYSHGKTCWS